MPASSDVLILGGGISGLSLAEALARAGLRVRLLEANPQLGGLLRTFELAGQLFDTGPHGIYSHDPEVEGWFRRLLGAEMQRLDRNSYLLFRGRRVPYPLTIAAALRAVRPLEAARVAWEAGVGRALKGPPPAGASFEEWTIRSFGPTLYRLFFEGYTEKVWGIPCSQLSATWISSHLPANSLLQVLYNQLRDRKLPIGFVRSFHYSTRGCGLLVERLERSALEHGADLHSGRRVTRLERDSGAWRVETAGPEGDETWTSPCVVSTMPVAALLEGLHPAPPDAVRLLARGLRFRNLIQVLLVVDSPRVSDANWLYVPDPALAVSRISEYKNMIGSMRDRPDTSLGLELLCWPSDPLWSAPDQAILERTLAELEGLGLVARSRVTASRVVRIPNAYPLFELGYDDRMGGIRDHLAQREQLHLLGRTAAFEYLDQAGCVRQALDWARNHLRQARA